MTNDERAEKWLQDNGLASGRSDWAHGRDRTSLAALLAEAEERGRSQEAKRHDNGVRFGGDEPDPGYGDWSG